MKISFTYRLDGVVVSVSTHILVITNLNCTVCITAPECARKKLPHSRAADAISDFALQLRLLKYRSGPSSGM
jgi:hypothetical protein